MGPVVVPEEGTGACLEGIPRDAPTEKSIPDQGAGVSSSPGNSYSAVDRYRSPWLASTATISLPLFSGRLAISKAAWATPPEEMPTIRPSSRDRKSTRSELQSRQ